MTPDLRSATDDGAMTLADWLGVLAVVAVYAVLLIGAAHWLGWLS